TARSLIGWLPDAVLSETFNQSISPGAPRFSEPDPVTNLPEVLEIESSSQLSPGGRYLLLRDTSEAAPAVWSLRDQSMRQLQSDARDLSWLPDGRGLVAVAKLGQNEAGPS